MDGTEPLVTLQRQCNSLLMQPACPDVLDCLQSVEHVLNHDRKRGSHLKATPRRLYDVAQARSNNANSGNGEVPTGITMAGLEPVVDRLLREKGYCVVGPLPVASLPGPDVDTASSGGVVDDHALELVQHHDRSLVRYGKKVNPAWSIGQIALAFPALTIAVATATVSAAQEIASELRRWLPADVLLIRSGQHRRKSKRIVIGTYTALLGGCMDLRQRELVIAVDAVEVLGNHGIVLLNAVEYSRLLGFLPYGRHVAARDADHIRGIFGFQEVHVPAHGYQPLPIDVVFERVSGGDRIARSLSGVALHRQAVWHNGLSFRRIAKLVQAICQRNEPTLAPFKQVRQGIGGRRTNRVAVVVANIEHGVAMVKRLSGWRLITGPDVNRNGMNKANRKSFAAATQVPADNVPTIVTTAAVSQIDPRQIDVLIRADAGTGLLPIKEELLMLPNGTDHRLLLVDYADRRHHELGRCLRLRRRAYRQRGWYAPGTDPIEERVQAFLTTRPKLSNA